eukprot:323960-Prorocentrum_minimum.AAC.1
MPEGSPPPSAPGAQTRKCRSRRTPPHLLCAAASASSPPTDQEKSDNEHVLTGMIRNDSE